MPSTVEIAINNDGRTEIVVDSIKQEKVTRWSMAQIPGKLPRMRIEQHDADYKTTGTIFDVESLTIRRNP